MQQRQRTWGWEAVVLTVLVLIGGVWLGGQAHGSGPAQPVSTDSPTSASGYPAPGPTPTTQPGPYPGPPTAAAGPPITGTAAPPPTTDPLRATATAAYAGGVTYDLLNRFSIRLLPGWHIRLPEPDGLVGIATIVNYRDEELEALDERPADVIIVSLTAYSLPPDTTFDQWLSIRRIGDMSVENGIPPGTTLSESEPISIGPYDGTSYVSTTPDGHVNGLIYLRPISGRILGIGIYPYMNPEGASAREEAMQILNTLEILPAADRTAP